ncbi:MAG TPA: hypothetical protein VGX48_04065 [Pyrinomonadaceae bacterium]|jgi:hypothetical protein|nr:hypothetical protein [Pyrinomonadaceae bacterium]
MAIKVENVSDQQHERIVKTVKQILLSVPREHTLGIERLRLVNSINDPRLKTARAGTLPGLYHPKQGPQSAWLEVALDILQPQNQPVHKRVLNRLSFKSNLAAVIFSLVGQHYYLTLRHSKKRTQIEPLVRDYTEKNLRKWSENQHQLRARLFKPLQPFLERWARSLQKRAKKDKAGG